MEEGSTQVKIARKSYWVVLTVIFGLALLTGVPTLWISFWFFLLWALCSLAWLLHISGRMDFYLKAEPAQTTRNGYIDLEFRIINDSFLPLPHSEFIIDGLDEEIFDSSLLPHNPEQILPERKSKGEDKIEFDDNFPYGSWKVYYKLKCLRRGTHSIGPFRVRMQTLFGALAVEKSFAGSKDIDVYPRKIPFAGRYHLESVEPYGSRRNLFYNPFNQLDHTECYDLRSFMPGDPFKLINWKVSARHGELYVRRPEVTNQARLVIGLEFCRDYYSSEFDQDLVLEKVISLATHLLLINFQVGFISYDDRPRYLPPAKGEKQFFLIRKLFTDLKSNCKGTLFEYIYNHRWAASDRLVWVLPKLDWQYLAGLGHIRNPGQMVSLIFTGEYLGLEYSRVLNHFYLWQLVLKDGQATVRRVETSWL